MNDGRLAGNRGRLFLGGLILITGIVAFLAYTLTGPMGIEERFASATGSISSGAEEKGAGIAGFSLEGQPVMYGVILVAILTGSWLAYGKFGV
jgi:hypothetical protein